MGVVGSGRDSWGGGDGGGDGRGGGGEKKTEIRQGKSREPQGSIMEPNFSQYNMKGRKVRWYAIFPSF